VPGASRPRPPTASSSSTLSGADPDHHRVAPSPVTLRQPDSCTVTGGKLCAPAANSSRTDPADAAGQCCPAGKDGSAHSAATMARTWVAPVSVTWRGDGVRLTTTRSASVRSVQSDPAAGSPATAAGALAELAPAEPALGELALAEAPLAEAPLAEAPLAEAPLAEAPLGEAGLGEAG
jgi:hypothetical protein